MRRLLILLTASIVAFAPGATAVAGDPALLAQRDTGIEKVFSDLERRVIREVLAAAGVETSGIDKKAKGSKGAPPGLARRNSLPPGLQRQLERNGRLPPGLEKKAFPAHLRAQLPSPLQGTQRLIVGNDAVLIDVATNVILDIIYDVVVSGN